MLPEDKLRLEFMGISVLLLLGISVLYVLVNLTCREYGPWFVSGAAFALGYFVRSRMVR